MNHSFLPSFSSLRNQMNWGHSGANTQRRTRSQALFTTSLMDLPSEALDNILVYLDLRTLGLLGMVSKVLARSILDYLEQGRVAPSLFYSCTPIRSEDAAGERYILGSSDLFYQMNNLEMAQQNFRELGVMMKRVTMTRPAPLRLSASEGVMHKINLLVGTGSNRDLMAMFGLYFHTFIAGWTHSEAEKAARKICNLNYVEVSTILQSGYVFGSCPMMELSVRNFLRFFFLAVDQKDKLCWLLTMFAIFVPGREQEKLGRLLMLATSSVKDAHSTVGIQWKDNMEAVPACLRVANFRYEEIARLIISLVQLSGNPDVLMVTVDQVVRVPEEWLPENKASLLVLMGIRLTKQYLNYLVRQALQKLNAEPQQELHKTIFKELSDVLLGLLLMQSRFKRSIDIMYKRFEEVVCQVPSPFKDPFYEAMWTSIAKEMMDVREGADDPWAKNSVDHIMAVISLVGERLTTRAFINRRRPNPATNEETGGLEASLSLVMEE